MSEMTDAIHDQLQALVGGRCYKYVLPQPYPYVLPAITFFRVDTPFITSHDGDSGLSHPRWQISCWASTGSGAEALVKQVRVAMKPWKASYGGGALPQDQRDMSDPETKVFQATIDYLIWWTEAL